MNSLTRSSTARRAAGKAEKSRSRRNADTDCSNLSEMVSCVGPVSCSDEGAAPTSNRVGASRIAAIWASASSPSRLTKPVATLSGPAVVLRQPVQRLPVAAVVDVVDQLERAARQV